MAYCYEGAAVQIDLLELYKWEGTDITQDRLQTDCLSPM